MNPFPSPWLSQVTTGHGCMVIVSTMVAFLSGTISWPAAVPLLVAGIVGLLWPENKNLQRAALTAATDFETTMAACQGPARAGTMPPAPGPGPAGLASLAFAGLALVACATQTAAEQSADLRMIESGIVCLADGSAKVAAVAIGTAADPLKAVQAAEALGGELVTNPACAPPQAKP